jgi:ribonuclease E
MTDMTAPGAASAPGFGAFIGSSDDDNSADRKKRKQTPDRGKKASTSRGSASRQSDEGAGGEGEAERMPKPRRRRGSRGGRKRSTRDRASSSPEIEEVAEAPAEKPSQEERGDPKPRRKRSRRKKARGSEDRVAGEETPEREEKPTDTGEEPRRRARRSRRGTRSASTVEASEPEADRAEPEAEASAPSRSRKRSGRKRVSRRRKSVAKEQTDDPEAAAESRGASEAEPERENSLDEDAGRNKARRRRGTRGGRSRKKKSGDSSREAAAVVEVIPGEEDDLTSLPDLPPDAEVLDDDSEVESASSPAKRTRRKAKESRVSEEKSKTTRRTKPDVVPDQQILVNSCDHEEVRVAVVQNGRILDFQMNVESDKSLVGDIYRGRVVNIEASIGAAFIDFGRGRNGFLHTSDVLPAYGEKGWSLSQLLEIAVDPGEVDEESSSLISDEIDHDEGAGEEGSEPEEKSAKKKRSRKTKVARPRFRPRRPIREMLKVGDRVVVQVTKDAIGDKGPTLTTYLSIPGRYLVLMPSMDHGGRVSRKIEDVKERRRLKRILDGLTMPKGMGIIARTAASGRTKVEIKRDLDYLLDGWKRFAKRLDSGHGPMTLYQESDVAIRTVRDLFSTRTESVIIDDEDAYQRIADFAELLMPEQVDRIKLHDGPRPLFHDHGVEQEFERIFTRRIELPSGGSIVFDQAEALVAIDVNSGKTRTASFDFEEIALKTNTEAVPEIARQIRLRDMGGILVIDFIDMMKMQNRRIVERAFRAELTEDRARSKVGRISQFGLLEMTRQRLGPGMSNKLFHNCPSCRGFGKIRTIESRAAAIVRRLGSAMTLKGFSTVEVRAQKEVLDHLKTEHADPLKRLEDKHSRKFRYTAVPDQVEDSVLRYLRADGREVRPGGRRKR